MRMLKDLGTINDNEKIIKRIFREKQSAETMIRWLNKAKNAQYWYQFDYILVWISGYNLYFVEKEAILFPVNTALLYVKVKDCRTVNPLWVMGTFISDYFVEVLSVTDIESVCGLEQAIFEIRKQYISEESHENDISCWMKLLFSVHNFNRIVQFVFKTTNQLVPDSKRYYNLNRELKNLYFHSLRNKNFWNGKNIVIKQIPRHVFPEIYVIDTNDDRKSMLHDYPLEEIIRMKISVDIKKREAIENPTLILVWIYSYILYPIRMRRLKAMKGFMLLNEDWFCESKKCSNQH